MSRKVLLHSCCAPCSSAILEWMLEHGVEPVIFFYNPNIFPEEEYRIRRDEIKKYADKLGIEFIEGEYDHQAWREFVSGLENEPERGNRCLECFKYRMHRAAKQCIDAGIDSFTTSLSSSRWKSLEQIALAGNEAAKIESDAHITESEPASITFDDRNWRKGGLQDRRNQLLKENGFYNQQYCGCEFSMRKINKTPFHKKDIDA